MADLASSLALASANFIHLWGGPFTYSRPESSGFDAVSPFTLTAILETSREYSDPLAPFSGALQVVIGDIPSGPRKGDLVAIAASGDMPAGNYEVYEIFPNKQSGDAFLKIRWTGQ
jgi:hypothetical protein